MRSMPSRASQCRTLYVIAFQIWMLGGIPGAKTHCTTDGPRVDCGYVGIEESECLGAGCCWSPIQGSSINLPWCFRANAGNSSYEVTSTSHSGEGLQLQLNATALTQPELGRDFKQLNVSLDRGLGSDTLHFKVSATGISRYEIPRHLFPYQESGPDKEELLRFDYTESPFSFSIAHQHYPGEKLFNTDGHRLIFKEQYLEITSWVNESSTFFGLGETTPSQGLPLVRDGVPITLWNRDRPSRYPDENLYGSYPFLLELREDGSATGVLLFNSNGMDIILTEETLSFRAIGGILDFYFFGGPTPADVLEQYTRLIGRPKMPPYWSLGFHQCKYGYKDEEELREVVRRYQDAKIPLDVMWTDIDYMDQWRDFTLNQTAFSKDKMQDFTATLHNMSMHYVVIIDPGIKVDRGYAAYDQGLKEDIFVKDVTGKPYLGQVWPGATHFPDFLHSSIQGYWEEQFRAFHSLLAYDGIWIDMNEISNFCSGEVCQLPDAAFSPSPSPSSPTGGNRANAFTDCFLSCSDISLTKNKSLLHPPYAISNAKRMQPLSERTLPTTAYHYSGLLEYDVHNLYGLSEAKVTSQALESVLGKRSFALTRSTFPGSGAYVAHWTGDNAATWNDLRWSIAMILNSGLNGIPFVGADICGFQLDTTEELCNRWISAGAFYPFARDHSDLGTAHQELYLWKSVAAAGRTALGLRYALLSYISTAFRESSKTGAPVAKPLWFEFPEDNVTHAIDQQWLLGSDILISPVLYEGASQVRAYVPEGQWYDAFSNSSLAGGRWVDIECPLGQVSVLCRGGSIIPLHQGGMTAAEVRNSTFNLVIAMPEMGQNAVYNRSLVAEGSLFFEDGEAIQVEESSIELKMQAWLTADLASGLWHGLLTINATHKSTEDLQGCLQVILPEVENVILLGWPGAVQQILMTHSNTTGPIDNSDKELKNDVEESDGDVTVLGALGFDWRCQHTASLGWVSAMAA